jgi:predicted Ser/Thr protein kinase
MNTEAICPQCQAQLPPDAPAGLCPRCLIRSAAGLGEPAPGADFPDIGDAADVARRLPQYEIIELLGQGGMGVVYKARQPALDRLIALKILPPADAQSPDFVERFRREARALAKLNHPNIVGVHEFGEAGGLYYFAMEYVDGANLRTLLQNRKLTPPEALAIVPRICDALEYAHEEGIIHRDIKPENLLIDKKGRVKIADFGLAKLLRREPLDITLTATGVQLGTLRYMAPEQVEKPETVDHRADIYSLGVVIYEMLTGEVPVGRFALPSERAQVDVRLDEVVLRSLERDVERRYQHASEVKTAVENIGASPAPAAAFTPVAPTIPMDPDARLSRCALWGAIWAPFTALGWPTWQWALRKYFDDYHAFFELDPPIATLAVFGFIIAATAPVGSTILGGLAIAHIKRSRGKLHGLPLGFVALMWHPLLVVGTGAFFLTHFVALTIKSILGAPGGIGVPGARPPEEVGVMDFILANSVVALVACFFVARAAWRAITGYEKKPPAFSGPAPAAPVAPVWPAWRRLLLASGSITISSSIATFLILFNLHPHFDAFFRRDEVMIAMLALQALAIPAGILALVGTRSNDPVPTPLARLGAKLALVPLTPGWLFTLPLGLSVLKASPPPSAPGPIAAASSPALRALLWFVSILGTVIFFTFQETNISDPSPNPRDHAAVELERGRFKIELEDLSSKVKALESAIADSREALKHPTINEAEKAALAAARSANLEAWEKAIRERQDFINEHDARTKDPGSAPSTQPRFKTTVGAFSPWLTIVRGHSIHLNFATWSTLAGVCAILAAIALGRARRQAAIAPIPAEGWALSATAIAFVLTIVWAIWSLVDRNLDETIIAFAVIPLAFLAATTVLILQCRHLLAPRTGWRALTPELCVLMLGAAVGGMPWSNVGFDIRTAWQYVHGAAYSILFLVVGLIFVATADLTRPRVWRATLMIGAGLAAFTLALLFHVSPPAIGDPDFRVFATVRLPGLYAAYVCGIFTALFGALQLRAAKAAR